MESEDLRLLEISGENDSLISPLPDIDTAINDFTFISPFRGLEDRVNPVKPGCSSRRVCSNKENINTDKLETSKLRLEPLHMKRKKRGGGYNLRKSLAWDRAFSTEEGVLDPVELSLLSGTLVNTCREALFTINEEERIPTSNYSQHGASSGFLNSKEKSTFKDVVALKEDKRKAPSKVLVSHNGRTTSRSSGCSRPLSSASLKRPANMNHGKSTTKDSKLPKFQVSKPSSCLLPTSSKSTVPRASYMKHQVTGSAISIQKNAGLKSSSRNVRDTQEKAKANAESLKDKSSCIFRGNNEKSTSRSHASTESSPPVNKASNNGMEMNTDATADLSESHDGCAPFSLRIPHSTQTAVSSMQYVPTQDMKPSGLRRPSPSVGFFRQTKASDTCRSLKTGSSMCPLQRSGDLRTPVALAKQGGKENLANLSCRILEFGSESSTASSQVIKTGLKRNCIERVNISSVIKNLDPVIGKLRYAVNNVDEKVPDHIEHEKKKPEDAELLMNGKWHPPQTGKDEHTNKDRVLMKFIENKSSAGSNFRDDQFPQANYKRQSLVLCALEDAIGNLNEAEESGICSVIDGSNCNSQYGNMINSSGEVTEEVYAGPCNNLPCGAFEKVNSFAVEDDRIFDNDKHIMKIKSNLSKAQRELRNKGGETCGSLIAGSDREEKMENSEDASQHADFQNLKEACPSKQIIDKKQPGGLVVEVSSEYVSNKKCETNPGGLSIYSEHTSQGGIVLHSSDRSLSKHVCMDEQIAETGLSAPLYRQYESCFDRFDETIEQTEVVSNRITMAGDPADIICFSPVKITLAENCTHSTDEEFNHDRIHANSTTCLEFVSSCSGTRDKMVSAAPGSFSECRKSVEESVLAVLDEAAIRMSYRHNEDNLTSSMEFGSFSRETQDVIGSGIFGPMGEGNKPIKDMCLLEGMDEFDIRDSSNKLNDGNQLIKVKHGLLSPESLKVEESQMCSHGDFIPCNRTERGHHKVVLESLHTPQLGDTRQPNEVGKATNAVTNILRMEDTHLDSPDNDAQLLPGKGRSTVVEECESSNAFENFRDALSARRSLDLGGLESPSFLNQESLIHGSSNDADELDVIHCVEDQLSRPVAIESLSSELDSSQGTSKNHRASVRIDCTEHVEGDQTSSTIKMKAVDILNQDIVVKESDTRKPCGSESSHSELCQALEDTEQCTNDNSNLPVKNRDSCPEKGIRLILPPRDAVPFSDEWLAAMEAAGEDILTMKGGAVQNSPQEKSLPEPSPWSPVKKKNNQLGPYDCTKFHHNVLPES